MDILKSSILQIFSNWRLFLITSAPLLAFFIILGAVELKIGNYNIIIYDSIGGWSSSLPERYFLSLLIFIYVFVFMYIVCFIAIKIHRYILIDKSQMAVKNLNQNYSVFSYLFKTIKISVFNFIVSIIFVWVTSHAFSFGFYREIILGFAFPSLLLWIFLRMSVALPAVALGQKMSLIDAFSESHSIRWELALIAIVLTVWQHLFALCLFLFAEWPAIVPITLSIAVNWFTLMLGIGIITNAYRAINERSLA